VVRAVNNANLILPSGDVKIGPFDYTIFTNSQFRNIPDINRIPVKAVGRSMVTVGDVGHAEDANQIQNNVVRVGGQPSAYLPVMKQGGDTNTIAVVDGVKRVVDTLLDVPEQLKAEVVFDQSLFVKRAIETLIDEAPDHGHETTSEAFSYWLQLEAQHGRVTQNWAPFNAAWAMTALSTPLALSVMPAKSPMEAAFAPALILDVTTASACWPM
jgi:hypothetical protein